MLFKHSCLSADGKLFYIFGPEVDILLSPNRVCVRGRT